MGLPAPTPPVLTHTLEYTDLDTTDTDTTWERDLLTPTLKPKLSHGWPTPTTDTHTLVPMPLMVPMPQLPMLLMELMLAQLMLTLVPTTLARDLLMPNQNPGTETTVMDMLHTPLDTDLLSTLHTPMVLMPVTDTTDTLAESKVVKTSFF